MGMQIAQQGQEMQDLITAVAKRLALLPSLAGFQAALQGVTEAFGDRPLMMLQEVRAEAYREAEESLQASFAATEAARDAAALAGAAASQQRLRAAERALVERESDWKHACKEGQSLANDVLLAKQGLEKAEEAAVRNLQASQAVWEGERARLEASHAAAVASAQDDASVRHAEALCEALEEKSAMQDSHSKAMQGQEGTQRALKQEIARISALLAEIQAAIVATMPLSLSEVHDAEGLVGGVDHSQSYIALQQAIASGKRLVLQSPPGASTSADTQTSPRKAPHEDRRLAAVTQELESISVENREVMARQRELGQENAALRETMRELEANLADEIRGSLELASKAQRDLAAVTHERASLSSELKQLREDLILVRSEKEVLCAVVESVKVQAEAKAKGARKALETELRVVYSERDAMLAEMRSVDERLSRMSHLDQGAGDQLHQVMAAHDKLLGEKRGLEARSVGLQRELREAQQARISLQARCDTLEEQLTRSRRDRASGSPSPGGSSAVSKRLADRVSALETELLMTQEDLSMSQKELFAKDRSMAEAISREMSHSDGENRTLRRLVDELKHEMRASSLAEARGGGGEPSPGSWGGDFASPEKPGALAQAEAQAVRLSVEKALLASKLRSAEDELEAAKAEIETMSLDLVEDRQELKRMLVDSAGGSRRR